MPRRHVLSAPDLRRRTEFPEDNALFERLAQPAQRPDSDYEAGKKASRRFSKEAFI